MVLFGQVVVGPPGAGKTTYCMGTQVFCETINRKCAIINVDFANDQLPYKPDIDARELVSLSPVMEELGLGPNGGLVYCMEYLRDNIEWLIERIEALAPTVHYILFDFPGQGELYTHSRVVYEMLDIISKKLDFRLCSVYLMDSFYCSNPYSFISMMLMVASSMLRLGLPHVNVLTKIDLLPMYGKLPFNLDFYLGGGGVDVSRIMRYFDSDAASLDDYYHDDHDDNEGEEDEYEMQHGGDERGQEGKAGKAGGGGAKAQDQIKAQAQASAPQGRWGGGTMSQRFKKMAGKLCEVLEDFDMVDFIPLNIQDGEMVARVLKTVDKANGFSLAIAQAQHLAQSRAAGGSGANQPQVSDNSFENLYSVASVDTLSYFGSLEIQERYTTDRHLQQEMSHQDVAGGGGGADGGGVGRAGVDASAGQCVTKQCNASST